MELKRYKLGEICPEFHAGNGIQSSQIKGSGLYPVFGGNGLRGYTDTFNQDGQYLIIGRQGAYCGNVRYNVGKAFLTEHAIVGQTSAEHNAIYLACKLSLMNLAQFQGQSAQPVLSVKNLSEIEILMPPKKIQDNIARVILNIDHKIALNRAINQNLEAMAKQLYDYWFVQFDFPNEEGKPYKSSGGEMVWNEKLKRYIPKGWNISLIKEIAATYSGGTPKSTNIEYYNNGEIAWINSGELNSPIITKTTNYITKCGLENSSAKLYPSNSILVAMYGATAGKVCLLTFEACSNQAVCGVIPTIENMLYYVYFHISSLYNHFVTLSTGSARDNISQETIKNILLPIPYSNILKLFDEKIGSIYQMIINNSQQIDSLAKQRDELLPLLMNDQVSVNSDLSVFYIVIFKYYASSVN